MKYLYRKLSDSFYAWALILVSAVLFLLKTIGSNAKSQLNGDEYLSLMASFFSFTNICFWHVKSFTAVSYPYSFVELSFYLRFLPHVLDHSWLYMNMEWVLRLTVVLHVLLAAFAAYFIFNRLTERKFLSAFLAVHVCLFPYSVLHLASELRHHSQGWSFSWFSWACLIGFLTVTSDSKLHKRIWLGLWLAIGFVASNTHIYAAYNLFAQILVFVYFVFNPSLTFGSRSKVSKVLCFGVVCVFASYLGLAYYQYKYKLRIPQPPEVTSSIFDFFVQATQGFSRQSFFPNLWVSVVVFFVYLFFNRREFSLKKKNKFTLWILLFGIFSQLFISIWLAAKTTSYSGVEFVGRYTFLTIPTLFVLLGFLVRFIDLSKKNSTMNQSTQLSVSHFRFRKMFLVAYVVFALSYFYIYQKTFWYVHDGEKSGFMEYKKQVLANDLLGKIYKTVGLDGAKGQPPIGKVFLGRSYVMYLNSPFPAFTQRQAAEGGACGYGGIVRLEMSCEKVSNFPILEENDRLAADQIHERLDQENVIADFCDPSRVVLRRIP